jgi:hypothetical protein
VKSEGFKGVLEEAARRRKLLGNIAAMAGFLGNVGLEANLMVAVNIFKEGGEGPLVVTSTRDPDGKQTGYPAPVLRLIPGDMEPEFDYDVLMGTPKRGSNGPEERRLERISVGLLLRGVTEADIRSQIGEEIARRIASREEQKSRTRW